MKKTALCILTDGFEEIEAITPIDLLRRADVELRTLSQKADLVLTGRCGVKVTADGLLDEAKGKLYDLLLLPGGPGVKTLCEDERVIALVRRHAEAGKWIAAICAAPLIVHRAGVLAHHRFTGHGSIKETLPGLLEDQAVVTSGKLITSRGAGTALPFGLEILKHLVGAEMSRSIAKSIHTM